MPQEQGEGVVIFFLLFLLVVWVFRPRCQHCGVGGQVDTVNCSGTHHDEGCVLYRGSCWFCTLFGRKLETERYGPRHDCGCRLYKGVCEHCGIEGPHDHISNDGLQHHQGCPRRPAVCNGCGIHTHFAILEEPAWSKWTEHEHGDQFWTDPHNLKFCQDSISRCFQDGTSVFDFRKGTAKILACFHREHDGTRLFALNNRTLFNVIHRSVGEVFVSIVDKPDDWPRRFTGSRPWMCVKVRGLTFIPQVGYAEPQALRIPASAFPGGGHRSICLVVLEARNLVNPKKDTLRGLLKEMSSDLDARAVDGPRAFARVRVNEDDVPLVRSMVKAIAERNGKNVRTVDCVEIQGMRLYESPRD